MASSGRSSTSKETDYPVFQNVDPRWCGREESILLDAIDAFGYGNWEVIADLFKFECADKNFTVQDIIDHCNLIFGRNALGAIYDSKAILERRTFLCDHTGSEDDALIDSSDINAAKNLTQEQLDSIRYMPLRGDFREVKEEDIASLIPEIRFKERYLQERCLRKNSTEDEEEDMELLLDQYNEEDGDDETEDGEDFCDEDGEKEVEDLKEEDLIEEVDETEMVEKIEFEMARRKMALSVDEEVKESRVRTRSSIFKDIQIKEEKREEMLSEQTEQVEEVEIKKAIYPFGRKLRSAEKHLESKIGEQERTRTVKESEKKVKAMEVVGRVKKGRSRRKNVKGKIADGRVQEKASHVFEKRMEEIEEKAFVSTRRRPVVKSAPMEEQGESEESGRNGKWMEKFSMEEETNNFDGTTEDEADEESFREVRQKGLDDGLTVEKEEKRKKDEDTESEESYSVDGNMIITEILVEAVDMYCKDMRDKALANRLISRHGLVEHYFKCGKKQTNKETQQKTESREPLDLRDASLVYGVLKTFARFMEPEALENFLKDFNEENRLRAKIDELRKELKNSDYAVFHFSSVNSDEDNGEVGGSSTSDSECLDEPDAGPESSNIKKPTLDDEEQTCYSKEQLCVESAASDVKSRIFGSEEQENSDVENKESMMKKVEADHHESFRVRERNSNFHDLGQIHTLVGSTDLEQKSSTINFDSQGLVKNSSDIQSSDSVKVSYLKNPPPEEISHKDHHIEKISDVTLIPHENSIITPVMSVDSGRGISTKEVNESNVKVEANSFENSNIIQDIKNEISKENLIKEITNPKEFDPENLESKFKDLGQEKSVSFGSDKLVTKSFNPESPDSVSVSCYENNSHAETSDCGENTLLQTSDDRVASNSDDKTSSCDDSVRKVSTKDLVNLCDDEKDSLNLDEPHSSFINVGQEKCDSKISTEKGSLLKILSTEEICTENLSESASLEQKKRVPSVNFDSKVLIEKVSNVGISPVVLSVTKAPCLKSISPPKISMAKCSDKTVPIKSPGVTMAACETSGSKISASCNSDREKSMKEHTDSLDGKDNVNERNESRLKVDEPCPNPIVGQDNIESKVSKEEDSVPKNLNSGEIQAIQRIESAESSEGQPIQQEVSAPQRVYRNRSRCLNRTPRQIPERKLEVRKLKFRKSSQDSSEDEEESNDLVVKRTSCQCWNENKPIRRDSSEDESSSDSEEKAIITLEGLGEGGSFNITGILKHIAARYPGGAEFIINPRFIHSVCMVARNGSNWLVQIESPLSFKILQNSDGKIPKEFGIDSLVMVEEDNINSFRVLMRELPKLDIPEKFAKKRKSSESNLTEEDQLKYPDCCTKRRKETDDERQNVEDHSSVLEKIEETGHSNMMSKENQDSAKMDEVGSNIEARSREGLKDDGLSKSTADEEGSSDEASNEESDNGYEEKSRGRNVSEEELENLCSEEEKEQESSEEEDDDGESREQSDEEEYGERESGEDVSEYESAVDALEKQVSDEENLMMLESDEVSSKDRKSDGEVSEMQDSEEETSRLRESDAEVSVEKSDSEISEMQDSEEEMPRVQESDEEVSDHELSDVESETSEREADEQDSGEEASDEWELSEDEEGKQSPSIKDIEGQKMSEGDSIHESDLQENAQSNMQRGYETDLMLMEKEDIMEAVRMWMDDFLTWKLSAEAWYTSSERKRKVENEGEREKPTIEADSFSTPTKRRKGVQDIYDDAIDGGNRNSVEDESNEKENLQMESGERSADEEDSNDDASSRESSNNEEMVSDKVKSKERYSYDEESTEELSEEEREEESCGNVSDQESGDEVSGESDGEISGEQESDEEVSRVRESNEEVSDGKELSDEESDENVSEEEEDEHESGEEELEEQDLSEEDGRQSPSIKESESSEKSEDEMGPSSEEEAEDKRSTSIEAASDEQDLSEDEVQCNSSVNKSRKMSVEESGQISDTGTRDHSMSDGENGQASGEEARDQEMSGEENLQETKESDEERRHESYEEETEYEELSEGESENQQSSDELSERLCEFPGNLKLSVLETEQISTEKEAEDLNTAKAEQDMNNKKSIIVQAPSCELDCKMEFHSNALDKNSNDEVAADAKSLNKLDMKSALTKSENSCKNLSDSVMITETKFDGEETTIKRCNTKEKSRQGGSLDSKMVHRETSNKISKESTFLEITTMDVDAEIHNHNTIDISAHEKEGTQTDFKPETSDYMFDDITVNNEKVKGKNFDHAGANNEKSMNKELQTVSNNEITTVESSEDEVYEVVDEEAYKQSKGLKMIQSGSSKEADADDELENLADVDVLENPHAEELDPIEGKEPECGTDNESIYELEEDDESGDENRMMIDEKSENQKIGGKIKKHLGETEKV